MQIEYKNNMLIPFSSVKIGDLVHRSDTGVTWQLIEVHDMKYWLNVKTGTTEITKTCSHLHEKSVLVEGVLTLKDKV